MRELRIVLAFAAVIAVVAAAAWHTYRTTDDWAGDSEITYDRGEIVDFAGNEAVRH